MNAAIACVPVQICEVNTEQSTDLICKKSLRLRSCRGRAVKTSDFHTGGPRFEPRPGSSALGQGALSSLPSLSEETLSRRSRV